MKHLNILLFNGFTTLDALGPAEVFSQLGDRIRIGYFSMAGGPVRGTANLEIFTRPIEEIEQYDMLLVPGGFGTRQLVDNADFVKMLKMAAGRSEKVLCVCTGSALLARTGLLDGKEATSNKLAWDWVIRQSQSVIWKRNARWVVDGKFYTSSGVTAGIDQALGFLADTIGSNVAEKVAAGLEYVWNRDKNRDLFAYQNNRNSS